jgi:hypothetical protein
MKIRRFSRPVSEGEQPASKIRFERQSQSNTMNTAISLHDYRLSFPDSAPLPTITQRGLIGPILERQRKRAIRRILRRAMWHRLVSLPGAALIGVVRLFTASARHAQSAPFPAAAHYRA